MPSRRSEIQMTDEELAEFLNGEPFGVLGTIGPTGFPHQVTIGFVPDGVRSIVMTSFGRAQKVANALRNPQASFLVERPTPYHQIRGVLATGKVSVITDPDLVEMWHFRSKDRSAGLLSPEELPPVDDNKVLPKRVLLVLDVERIVSWDHRKLHGVY